MVTFKGFASLACYGGMGLHTSALMIHLHIQNQKKLWPSVASRCLLEISEYFDG